MATKKQVSFEEMERIHNHWAYYDKTGTQAEVFKKHGWSRNKFFEEANQRAVEQTALIDIISASSPTSGGATTP